MASSSASGSKLAELEKELIGLKEQKAAELRREQGTRERVLFELNKDLDRVQAAISALFTGELEWHWLGACIKLVCVLTLIPLTS